MRVRSWHCLVFVWILFVACSDDPVSPSDDAFELRIRVVDEGRRPVEGLRVAAWSKAPCWASQDGCWWEATGGLPRSSLKGGSTVAAALRDAGERAQEDPRFSGNAPNPFVSGTTFRLDSPEPVHVDVRIYDQNGTEIRTLIDGPLAPGLHVWMWDGQPQHGASTINEVRCVLRDVTSDEIVLADTLYAAYYHTDPESDAGLLGYTDGDGSVTTMDRLRFPGVMAQPELVARTEDGVELGNFTFTDTLVIAVIDSLSGEQRVYERRIAAGKNDVELGWDTP